MFGKGRIVFLQVLIFAFLAFLSCGENRNLNEESSTVIKSELNAASVLGADSVSIGVLQLDYIPERACGADTCLNEDITGQIFHDTYADNLIPVQVIKKRIADSTSLMKHTLEAGSNYKGRSKPYLKYQIVDSKSFKELPILQNPKRPNYRQILDELNICDYVDKKNVKQIWMWSWHYSPDQDYTIGPPREELVVAPNESNMAMGRRSQALFNFDGYGDVSNSEHSNDMPICENTYVLFNYTYQSEGAGNPVHNHIHQYENLFPFGDSELFWQNFGGKQYFEDSGNWRCGNAHFPPNIVDKTLEYRYNIETKVSTACQHWDPDGEGIPKEIGCEAWGCTELGFYVWWMQQIPGYGNQLKKNGRFVRNWWQAVYDFDNFYGENRSLVSNLSAPGFTCAEMNHRRCLESAPPDVSGGIAIGGTGTGGASTGTGGSGTGGSVGGGETTGGTATGEGGTGIGGSTTGTGGTTGGGMTTGGGTTGGGTTGGGTTGGGTTGGGTTGGTQPPDLSAQCGNSGTAIAGKKFACNFGGNCNVRQSPSSTATLVGSINSSQGYLAVLKCADAVSTVHPTWVCVPLSSSSVGWVWAGNSYGTCSSLPN